MMAQRWPAAVLPLLLPSDAWAGVPKKRAEDHVRGKELWDRSCWQCHGKQAAGDGPSAEARGVTVPDLRGQVGPDRHEALVQIKSPLEGNIYEGEINAENHTR